MTLKSLIKKQLIHDEYALLMSDGIDSKALLFACLESNIKVTVYSFTLDDRESKDFIGARQLCESLGVKFVPIYLSTDIRHLISDIKYLISKYKLQGKANVECSWVMYNAILNIKEDNILTGHGCDGHFGLSKRAMIHHKHSIESMVEFRSKLFNNVDYAQRRFLNEYCDNIGKTMTLPYVHKDIIELFMYKSWSELNVPIQKLPIVEMYKDEFSKIKVNKHVNFQLGDSGISELFKQLLKIDELNVNNYKNPVGIYNLIFKNYHT